MIIELMEDLPVRVPEERLPLGTKSEVFHTFKAGTKGNYSSEPKSPGYTVHYFSSYAGKFGVLTAVCVMEFRGIPNWL